MASHRPLYTPRLSILPADVARLEILLANPASFTFVTGLKLADGYCPFPNVLRASLDKMRRADDFTRPWLTPRLVVPRDSQDVIGVLRFNGAPLNDRIDLGYSIAPAYQRKGFATEAVRAMAAHTLAFAEIRALTARTAPEPSASTRVLEKCGFQRLDEIIDPSEGPVWMWERAK